MFDLAVIIVLGLIAFLCNEINYLIIAICMIVALAALIYLIRQYIERNQYKLFEKIM